MEEEAYQVLHALETEHWWYAGARAVYRVLLEKSLGPPGASLKMLEVGCGSGGNLRLLGEWGPVAGAELAREALEMVPERPALGLVQADAAALPFACGAFDGVHLLGVIEHLADDQAALQEARRVCRPGGAVTVLTSAVPWLWSHHDRANRHQRRYWLPELRRKLETAGLSPLLLSYQNFFVFLPVLAVRLWQRRKGIQAARYDMGAPPGWLNDLLLSLVKLEAWLLRWFSLPIGVDLVAACRAPGEQHPPGQ